MRTTLHKTLTDPELFKNQLLLWAQSFREVLFLDSNGYRQQHAEYDVLLAADAFLSLKTDTQNAFSDLQEFRSATTDWIFGYLSYDLKNDTEALVSENPDHLEFPDLFFFQPKRLFRIRGKQLEMSYLPMCEDEMEDDFRDISNRKANAGAAHKPLHIQARIPHKTYLEKVTGLLSHIQRGDIYEANFCMEFFSDGAQIDPVDTYRRLNDISEPPFACYFRQADHYLLCASPERYLKKKGNKIISQPIKGTARRSDDPKEDERIRKQLTQNEKERSENIMIVDLVRNDLSRTAIPSSVKVEELCEPYRFRQVHQLISTVVSEVSAHQDPVEVIRTTFPMGSMTGAPKISAMKLIEAAEESKRGLYSGAVGYIEPDGNFDFNVVIRSILYNKAASYVSFSVGSAITAASVPQAEYEECLIKAAAMRQVLEVPRS